MIESLMRVSRGLVEAIGSGDTEEMERLAADRGLVLERLVQWERELRGHQAVPEGGASPLDIPPDVRRQLQEDDAAIIRGLELRKRKVLQNIETLNRKRKLSSYMDEARQ
jgi:hypothetical protein